MAHAAQGAVQFAWIEDDKLAFAQVDEKFVAGRREESDVFFVERVFDRRQIALPMRHAETLDPFDEILNIDKVSMRFRSRRLDFLSRNVLHQKESALDPFQIVASGRYSPQIMRSRFLESQRERRRQVTLLLDPIRDLSDKHDNFPECPFKSGEIKAQTSGGRKRFDFL
ncbi:MAG: hypothetical protein ABR878_08090 [Roseiarcus sp.]